MLSASFVSFVFLAVAACAHPVVQVSNSFISLPFTHRIRANVTTPRAIYEHDLARVRYFASRGRGDSKLSSTTGANELNIYLASIKVGSPATSYTLAIDTGSSNTWVGADKAHPYEQTKTSQNTGRTVSVSYAMGEFTGTEFIDKVTVASGLSITQSIGVANSTVGFGFGGVDGILGLGPNDLTNGTVDGLGIIPTIVDNLAAQRKISNQFGIYFQPVKKSGERTGEITWGGIDKKKIKGDITFVNVTTKPTASLFWGIDQSITYGKDTTLISSGSGILDTGTTLLMLATPAYEQYLNCTGATLDFEIGLLTISPADFANLQSMFFTIGDTTFEFTANAQTFPRSLNTALGLPADTIFLMIGEIPPLSQSPAFINGYAWMERFYTVYDSSTNPPRVGIATTAHTFDTTN